VRFSQAKRAKLKLAEALVEAEAPEERDEKSISLSLKAGGMCYNQI
jgi:hypothetical protein